MTPQPTTVTPDAPVSLALERMAALGVGRLPVVSTTDPGKLVGVFRREDAIHAYHRALEGQADAEMARRRLQARAGPEADFFAFTIAPSSTASDKAVRDVAWPSGCTLVSVQRGSNFLVPSGDTVLMPNDILTVFGSPDAKRRLQARLGPVALDRDDIGA